MITRSIKSWLIMSFLLIINPLLSLPCAANPTLQKSNYAALPRWNFDKHQEALAAFKNSCAEILRRPPNRPFTFFKTAGSVRDWQRICLAALQLSNPSDRVARQFFEYWFTPYVVSSQGHPYGLFTGYYLPIIPASLQKSAQYTVPIYGLPYDLLEIPIPSKNAVVMRTVTRQVKNHLLYPYPDRAAIDRGAIIGRAPIIAWAHNKIDVFFGQIQGSAILELPNHQQLLIGYAGHNGKPYVSIGKRLVDYQLLTKENVSMQTIRAWLEAHPHQVDALLNQNPSYVFFRLLPSKQPLGTEHVPLTPERSLAVDQRYIPMGAPVWLNTVIPYQIANNQFYYYRHLLIAQDTGAAIKGAVRGDIYWGNHKKADFLAGNMKSPGQYWLLLPKS